MLALHILIWRFLPKCQTLAWLILDQFLKMNYLELESEPTSTQSPRWSPLLEEMPVVILMVLYTSDCQVINVGDPKLGFTIYVNNFHRTRYRKVITTYGVCLLYMESGYLSLPFLHNSIIIKQGPPLSLENKKFKIMSSVHMLGLWYAYIHVYIYKYAWQEANMGSNLLLLSNLFSKTRYFSIPATHQ